jgi:hypothetical protein
VTTSEVFQNKSFGIQSRLGKQFKTIGDAPWVLVFLLRERLEMLLDSPEYKRTYEYAGLRQFLVRHKNRTRSDLEDAYIPHYMAPDKLFTFKDHHDTPVAS